MVGNDLVEGRKSILVGWGTSKKHWNTKVEHRRTTNTSSSRGMSTTREMLFIARYR
jgi:hypothetical protein